MLPPFCYKSKELDLKYFSILCLFQLLDIMFKFSDNKQLCDF